MIFSRKQSTDQDNPPFTATATASPSKDSSPQSAPIQLTAQEQSQISEAFESPTSVFKLLSTLRTRRVGLGYSIETGEEETFTWSSQRTHRQAKGPLSHRLDKDPIPLSEIEEALVAWAGVGLNGTIMADIPINGGLSGIISSQGRTIPASSNDLSVDLFIINDAGVSLYRPISQDHAPIEIAGADDYGKVLAWYRNNRTILSSSRPDVAWFSAPEATQNVNPMGPGQYNINRPASTWLLPVCDIGLEWFNQLLMSYEWSGFYLMDPGTGEPAGCKEWICPGFLEVGFPIPAFDELALLLGASQAACSVQNMRLAAEQLGIGAWPIGSYADDLVLGAYPEICQGLGFSFLERDDATNPSKTLTCLGLPGIKDAVVVPSARFPDARSAVRFVKELRYPSLSSQSSVDTSFDAASSYNDDIRQEITQHPRYYISDWAEEACVATVEYIVDKYGCCPAFVNPVRAKFSVQLHHVDQSFYNKFQTGNPTPYGLPSAITSHFATWHPNTEDPSAPSSTPQTDIGDN